MANRPTGFSRRQFLAGGTAAAAWAAWATSPAGRAALAWTRAVTLNPAGTTLQSSIVTANPGTGGYVRLTEGPGWPFSVRSELASPKRGREDRRQPLAAFVHFTDTHLVDTESPGRVEFLDDVSPLFMSAWRPQETMSTQVLSSMVQRVNEIGAGPVTGRPLDCMVATGDNVDNQERVELDWFLGVLEGQPITPTTGDPALYHGVQDGHLPHPRYWHPDPALTDPFKADRGFPSVEGLLDSVIAAHHSPGLDIPWFSVFGNHDCNVQGNGASSAAIEALFVGDRKITGLADGEDGLAFVLRVFYEPESVAADLAAGRLPFREVPADDRRRPVSRRDWIQAHLDLGAGAHGYTEEHATGEQLHYTFDLSPAVLGIALDTTNHAGGAAGADGSIGEGQLAWLEARLQEVSTRWFDPDGREVRRGGTDRFVMVFSHHTAATMTATDPDPARPGERRIQGAELTQVLMRYPNVVAWVNGHTHVNEIVPRGVPGRGGYWEISTASHIDHPQHARIIELVDNGDDTVSVFTTLIDHAAPARADHDDRSVLGLAALSREVGANDPQPGRARGLGGPESHNTELILAAPRAIVSPPTAPTTRPERPARPTRPARPAEPVGASPRYTG